MVRGRKIKETGQWVLKSHVGTHTCVPPDKADRSKGHRQLTSEYLGYKLLHQIAHDPTVKVKFLMSSMRNNSDIDQVREGMDGEGKGDSDGAW